GPQNVTQLALCEFLGYQLPVLAGSVAERQAIAASLGTVFTAARLTRYAQLCTAPTTERLLRTYDEDGVPAGREAYQRALVGSGTRRTGWTTAWSRRPGSGSAATTTGRAWRRSGSCCTSCARCGVPAGAWW